jgi:alpha-glutamyl/putrescinyl thymine pyrophosphorylase clade 1
MQHLTDLNYSPVINFDENDWIVPGPGCLDGMRKCFKNLWSEPPSNLEAQAIILYLVDGQEEGFEARKLDPVTLFGRRLSAIDMQNCFCEVDKYARVAHPAYNLPEHRSPSPRASLQPGVLLRASMGPIYLLHGSMYTKPRSIRESNGGSGIRFKYSLKTATVIWVKW